jgi:phospholipase A-2-activating protein
VLSTGEFAAAGDDGTLRIYSADGQREVQVIPHPSSIRCVKALPNGDIATGAADRVLRVFTRNPDRMATAEDRAQFAELCALVAAGAGGAGGAGGGMSGLDTSSMKDESVLQQPGKKHGAIQLVMTKKGPWVYRWDANNKKWEEVGTFCPPLYCAVLRCARCAESRVVWYGMACDNQARRWVRRAVLAVGRVQRWTEWSTIS